MSSASPLAPYTFSPDGRQLLFVKFGPTSSDILVRAIDADGTLEPLLATEFGERNAEISPDGHWLAYQSNASGQFEIYVRPFPNVDGGRWQISTGERTYGRSVWSSMKC